MTWWTKCEGCKRSGKPLPKPCRCRDVTRSTLWTAFKTATDAIFTARDAARAAKEAEFSTQIKAREEIIERLTALRLAGSAPEIKRAMAEADKAWRAVPKSPGRKQPSWTHVIVPRATPRQSG